MKKHIFFSVTFLAFIIVLTSAFTTTSITKTEDEPVPARSRINELYWYASDDVSYTGHFRSLQDEMNFLAAAQPSYYFYSSAVSGSVAYEFGYTVSNPSGAPAQTIYRKLK